MQKTTEAEYRLKLEEEQKRTISEAQWVIQLDKKKLKKP